METLWHKTNHNLWFCMNLFTLPGSGVSNTRPAGRMWPTRCICAARKQLKNWQNYNFWSFLAHFSAFLVNCSPQKLFFNKLRPAEPFFLGNAALQYIWVWDPCLRWTKHLHDERAKTFNFWVVVLKSGQKAISASKWRHLLLNFSLSRWICQNKNWKKQKLFTQYVDKKVNELCNCFNYIEISFL